MSRVGRDRLALTAGLGLLVVVLLLVNLIASRHYLRADWTRGRVFSLSMKTEQVLRTLDRPVEIKVFMLPPARQQESLYYETRELLRRFEGESAQIEVEYVDIDKTPARAAVLSQKYGVQLRDLAAGLVVFASGDRVQAVQGLDLGDYEMQREGRRMVAFHGEALFLDALLSVSRVEQVTVCFSQGHDEPSPEGYRKEGYGHLWDEVRRANYRVRVVDPHQLLREAQGCGIVVLGGPRSGFTAEEVRGLEAYLSAGGRLLALIGPQLDRRVTRFRDLGLESMLRGWGIGLADNIVVDPRSVPGEQPLLTWSTRTGYGKHPIGRALRGRLTVWPLTRQVDPLAGARTGLSSTPLVVSSGEGWAETDLGQLRGDQPLRRDSKDREGPVTVGVAVRWRNTRIVVFGSERGVLNRRLAGRVIRDFNRDLVLASLDWLAGRQRQVALGPKRPEHVRLVVDAQIVRRIFLICVVGLPLLSLSLALLVWWRRRR